MNLAYEAMMFAREVHKDQRRKYSGNPYADHLAEVAGIVATVVTDLQAPQEVVIATAWLHDSVEDQGVLPATLRERFGPAVEEGVMWLSDVEQGNRAERKRASCERLAQAPGWVQTIKCADLISNTSSIVLHDPHFARVYLREKRDLLAVMTRADLRLHVLASARAVALPGAEVGREA